MTLKQFQTQDGVRISNTPGSIQINNRTMSAGDGITVTVGNADYWAIVNRANNQNNGVESSAVAYDSMNHMITLHVSEVYDPVTDDDIDILIISKFDAMATLLWQKQLLDDVDVDLVHDICIDAEDNIVVATSVDNGQGIDSILVLKLDVSGNILWQRDYQGAEIVEITLDGVPVASNTVGSTTFGGVPAQTVTLDADYAVASTNWILESSSDGGNTYTFVGTLLGSSYDSNNDQTILYFPASPVITLDRLNLTYRLQGEGASSFQEIGGVVCDANYIYVAGEYIENTEAPFDGQEALILKISLSDGSLEWSKKFNFFVPTRLYGMDVAPDGTLAVVGVAEPGEVPDAAFVTKLESDGSHVWTKILFGPEINTAYSGADVVVDTQNNIIMSFNSRQTIVHELGNSTEVSISHLIKMNGAGETAWVRRIGPGPCASVGTGIDCDNLGNIYLSALTVVQDNPVRDFDNFFNSKNLLAVAKFSPAGVPNWQRVIDAQGYFFSPSREDDYDYNVNRGRFLSVSTSGKLAVQVTAKQLDLDDNVPDNDYWESITFQIDQDGRTLTLGSGNELFTVKESRIPGRFITVPEFNDGELTTEDVYFSDTITTKTLQDGLLAQQVARSATYDYAFGNDGTITVPNDGDLKLVQTQIGWFSIFGPARNNNDDIWFRANCVDPETGDVYAVGQEDDNNQGIVARYNSEGQILWSVTLSDQDNGNNTRCNAVKLVSNTRNIQVLCEYFGNETGTLIVEIDTDTAQVVSSLGFRDENENNAVNAYDFDFLSNGDVVVVGRKYDEYFSLEITPQTGSMTNTLIVSNAAVESGSVVHPVQNSWTVTGTGITGRASITEINRYNSVSGPTTQGSGAQFSIVDNGDGTYGAGGVDAAGVDYQVGHKILILGTSLGGTTPTNDCIVTVQSVTGTGVLSIAVTGTAAGVTPTTYNSVSGTNYQVGSGFQADITYDVSYDGISANITAGTNYVAGDIITVPGTSLGGTTPTNDLIVTVTSVGGSGDITGLTYSGTAQTTIRKLTVDQAVDFGGVGTWSVGYDLGGEAFVWTEGWSQVLSAGGQYDTERYLSVAVDANDNIYAVGEMISRDGAAGPDLNDVWCAVVSKFNSAGTHQWTKALNNTTDDCYAKGVAVLGSVVSVTFENSGTGDTVITKLDTAGNIKWQRVTDSNDDSSVAIDSNGDIYVAMEYNFETQYEDVIKVIRLAANGEPIWRKFFGTIAYSYGGTNERFKNGRNLTIDDASVYVSGYTTAYADDYESGFLVKLPKSGDCDGYYGSWTVQSDTYDVSAVFETEATTFTPVTGTGNFELWEPAFETNWYDASDDGSYHVLQEIRDRDGGAIVFADGTRQTSSAQIIPQVKIDTGADHRLTQEDAGKHIYVTNDNTSIIVPYHEDNPLPIGFSVVIVNFSGSSINIDADGGGINIVVPGSGSSSYWDLDNEGMATLLKVDTFVWFMTGNVTQD